MSHSRNLPTILPLAKRQEGKPITLFSHVFPSPVGPVYFLVTREGAVFRMGFSDVVFQVNPNLYTVENNKYACGEVAYQLDQYFQGERRTFELDLVTEYGTDFEFDVWNRLIRIEYGQTMSYGEVAQKVGRRNAARAVGNAVGKNPVPIIIPCHRVVPASGGLGNYSAQGMDLEQRVGLKAGLLHIEGAIPAGFI